MKSTLFVYRDNKLINTLYFENEEATHRLIDYLLKGYNFDKIKKYVDTQPNGKLKIKIVATKLFGFGVPVVGKYEEIFEEV